MDEAKNLGITRFKIIYILDLSMFTATSHLVSRVRLP